MFPLELKLMLFPESRFTMRLLKLISFIRSLGSMSRSRLSNFSDRGPSTMLLLRLLRALEKEYPDPPDASNEEEAADEVGRPGSFLIRREGT